MKFLSTLLVTFALAVSGSALADTATGQSTYAARGCIGCHGFDGKSILPAYPSLVGRDAAFVKKNLSDFRSGTRQNPTMNAMAAGLSDSDIDNLADYIDSLK